MVPGASGGFAHGKVILLGEHSVVYGQPALCGALGRGVTVRPVASARSGALGVAAWQVRTPAAADLLSDGDPGSDLGRAHGALLRSLLAAAPRVLEVLDGVELAAEFAIPTGAGLGSSAALAVATARAIDERLRAVGPGLAPADIAAAALAAETVFHGRPSGLDHTVAQHGGFGLFRRGAGGAPGTLTPLEGPPLTLLIAESGRARDTRGRVARVAELVAADEAGTRARFDAIGALVEDAAAAVRRGDLPRLGRAMNDNQALLGQLEVSCPELEALCARARDAGALGAKLTGGGGGGCIIAVAEPEVLPRVAASLRDAGFAAFTTLIGTQIGGARPAVTNPEARP